MKKFDKPFDDYELSIERPMSIELHPAGLTRYLHLASNPIYYLYAFQYTKGDFYRAVLGYEAIWDSDFESVLVKQLDLLLNLHANRREYFLEEVIFDRSLKIVGQLWHRGVRPKRYLVKTLTYQLVPRGTRALARVNLLDKPNHVDLELETGEIYTVAYMHYRWWNQKNIRSLDHANLKTRPKQNSNDAKDAGGPAPSTTEGLRTANSLRALLAEMPSLRERYSRAKSLRKARAKV